MKMITSPGFCPTRWKNAKTIILYKDGEINNPGNWRPLTVTSVIYRALSSRISQSLHEAHELQGISMLDI
jgi:hypothetical protein